MRDLRYREMKKVLQCYHRKAERGGGRERERERERDGKRQRRQ
jgi:hypothetical protein